MSRQFALAVALFVLAGVASGVAARSIDDPASPGDRAALDGEIVTYGDAPSTFGRLWVPAGPGVDSPAIVVLVHGGFWRSSFGLDTTDPLAQRLADEGFAVWNIEYGRSGERFGGWPHTFEHVTAALDVVPALADEHDLDARRVAIVGHSAGGHLALWVGGQPLAIDPAVVVGLGAVADVDRAAADGLGRNAVEALLGAPPADVPTRLAAIRPRPSVPAVLINGELDDIVPAEYSQPVGFEADVRTLAGLDHFDLIDAEGTAATELLEVLSVLQASGEE